MSAARTHADRSWLRPIAVHWRRLARVPSVRVVEVSPTTTHVVVGGLVCSVCAARTAAAFARLPGVEAARVDLASGRGELAHASGRAPSVPDLERALASVVIAPAARRWLEAASRIVRGGQA